MTERGPLVCVADGCDRRSRARRLCPAHYQQAWKAREIGKHEKLPSRVRDPKVCPPDHKHGASGTCYVHHQCRCEDCSAARSKRDGTRRKLKAYGRYDAGLVDAEPVREHILALAEFGIGYKRVAEVSGIGVTAVRNLVWGRQDPGPRKGELQRRVKRATAEAILAVEPDVANLADGGKMPARGTHRRLQALVARGWSLSKLAERLGVQVANLSSMMQREQVFARTHRQVVALYEELWDQLPPRESWHDRAAYTRAIGYAKARRWLPPLAWDDIDTDEEPPVVETEGEEVDSIAVELACAGEIVRLTRTERRAAVTQLQAEGMSDNAIADRLHLAARSVLRIRQELGLPAAVDAGGNHLLPERAAA
jgi:transcriptional regulator with XRE-family HTH domain